MRGWLRHHYSVSARYAAKLVVQPNGSVAVIFAIALVPVMIAAGAAVDYSRANNFRSVLQATLDASVLAGAKDGSSNWSQVASSVFAGAFQPKFGSASPPTFAQQSAEVYSGTVTGSVPTTMLGIISVSSIPVSVAASAQAAAPDNSCILTLDHGQPTTHVSLDLNGAPVVNLSGCSIRSNTGIDCNGHDGNNTQALAGGSASACTHPDSYAPIVPDVYASLATNIQMVCGSLRDGLSWTAGSSPSGSGLIVVDKGAYKEYHICGDLSLSGTDYLTGSSPANDTIIVIENGSLSIANGSNISTARTAIVLTGSNSYASSINFPNGNGQSAALTLSAPTDSADPWQGVALYQDPALTYRIDDRWGPGATFNAEGLVYLGNANVVTDGNTGSNDSQCSKFVMNSFTTNGSVNLDLKQQVSACAAVGLKQWTGVVVHLIK
jgi:hypothetical protein